jgi:hypothetical protein
MPQTDYRGVEPDRFFSRRFFSLDGSPFRVPATTARFMSTQDLGVSIRSNHSSLPSSGARTTDPWQTFWHRTRRTSACLHSARMSASWSHAREHFFP